MISQLKRVSIASWLLLGVLCAPVPALAEAPRVNLTSQSDKVKRVEAVVTIDAPPATVWGILTDYRNLKSVLPDYERTDVVSESAGGATMDMAVKAGSLAPTFKYRVKIQENRAANTLSIQRVSGDFNAITASYRLLPLAGGSKTSLVYHLNIDIGGKFPLPGANHMLKASTQKSMAAVQRACAEKYRRSFTANR